MSFLRDYLHIFSAGSPIQKEEALPITRGDILHFGVKLAASALIAYVSVRIMVRYLDPTYAGELGLPPLIIAILLMLTMRF